MPKNKKIACLAAAIVVVSLHTVMWRDSQPLLASASAEEKPTHKKSEQAQWQAKELLAPTKESPISSIDVLVQLRPKQVLSPDGIRFDLIFKNPTDKSITIWNPFDFMRVTLADEQGKAINLPDVPSRFRAHGSRESGQPYAFKVGHQSVNKDPAKKFDPQSPFVIPAGGMVTVPISLDSIVQGVDPKGTLPQVGSYTVTINISLLEVPVGEQKISRNLEIEGVSVEIIK